MRSIIKPQHWCDGCKSYAQTLCIRCGKEETVTCLSCGLQRKYHNVSATSQEIVSRSYVNVAGIDLTKYKVGSYLKNSKLRG